MIVGIVFKIHGVAMFYVPSNRNQVPYSPKHLIKRKKAMSVINTNVSSLLAQRNLDQTQRSVNQSIERLSTGSRINSAKDDAVGLAQANRMTAQISGNAIAQRNINDGISLSQTVESNLNSINDNLLQIRDLAQQATSDTISDDDRATIQSEIGTRVEEINRISADAEFNGIKLMDGSNTSLTIQTGADTSQEYDITLEEVTATTLIVDDSDVAVDVTTGAVTDVTTAQSTIDAVDNALSSIDSARSKQGSMQNTFDGMINQLETTNINLQDSRSSIMDTDFAEELSNLTKNQILQQAGTSVLAQANAQPNMVLSLLMG